MPRILHIGVGNFHRAHQAWYTAHAGGDWNTTGIVMGNQTLFDALSAGGGYSLGIRGPDGLRVEWIDTHDRVLLARDDSTAVIAAIADPDVAIVTLTITEKGYCLVPQTGQLDLGHPAVRADLCSTPSSAIGLLAHGLAARMDLGLGPLTVISCDNISRNGRKLAAAIAAYAAAACLSLDPRNRFPDTMVDRITPATSDDLSDQFADLCDRPVVAAVLTEAFSEWVIEDAFAGPRPAWEKAGAVIVTDPAPFEMRKLRLLNAAHSYMAYAGQLAGHKFVHEAFADPEISAHVRGLWHEATATLPPSVSITSAPYCDALAARFSVPELRHSLAQIAVDGSLKLGERLVPMIDPTGAPPFVTIALAAWIAFVTRSVRANQPLADANASALEAAVQSAVSPVALSRNLLAIIGVVEPAADWLDRVSAQADTLGG